ncbi:MAG: type secretion system ATPase, FliI/YscN [Acidimicrobiaceae bacterium]|nr:type secretion system ATPase, FliI/YscN [Acidimicrobiaceae bacterium]
MNGLLDAVRPEALAACGPRRYGRIVRMVGMSIEVAGVNAALGGGCLLHGERTTVPAELVALHDERSTCLPLGDTAGLRVGDRVEDLGGPLPVRVGPELLGRVLDGLGRPLDDGPALFGLDQVSIDNARPHPLRRALVDRQLPLGVRVLDGLLPCGVGQRLGIFAGSGVGKSSLMSMLARGSAADLAVVALVGERGREVAEFIERDLGPEGLARSVVVVATSDEPALVRLRAAFLATRIAEWFRDRGDHVLLMMDSLTRFAMAQREVGLAAGEPPATRGYPPSVFGLLPRLLERAGTAERGSITGLYTVLVEGDDMNEPIADTARSILDGHIQLSRSLAEAGHYPAVDVLGSISRVAPAVASKGALANAGEVRRLLAAYRDAKDLIEIDAYARGSNPVVDRAILAKPAIDAFCRQGIDERTPLSTTTEALAALVRAAQAASPGSELSP